MRHDFPAKVKLAAFQRAAGRCESCTARLFVGRFHYDHRIPDAMGGEATLANCQVLCTACHGGKTRAHDVPAIARTKRQAAKHAGIRKPSTMPGSRGSRWKRRMDGTTVLRELG